MVMITPALHIGLILTKCEPNSTECDNSCFLDFWFKITNQSVNGWPLNVWGHEEDGGQAEATHKDNERTSFQPNPSHRFNIQHNVIHFQKIASAPSKLISKQISAYKNVSWRHKSQLTARLLQGRLHAVEVLLSKLPNVKIYLCSFLRLHPLFSTNENQFFNKNRPLLVWRRRAFSLFSSVE